jgi:hypothetical protein
MNKSELKNYKITKYLYNIEHIKIKRGVSIRVELLILAFKFQKKSECLNDLHQRGVIVNHKFKISL